MKSKKSPYPKWVNEYRKPGTEIRKIGDKFYVYSVSAYYDAERKKGRKKTGPYLGRITQQDGFIEAISRKVPKDLRTTLTSGQHKDHIATEQRVSRHSMPELLYFLFFPPHIFIQFPRHTASTFANRTKPTHHPKFAKEPFPYP